mmetsp:Transcript_27032/g.42909  ORF Transcript_27032/g.42909 Transcript_27032/m.42909 type:complete len:237 (-) Transcript_27032:214-924(-)
MVQHQPQHPDLEHRGGVGLGVERTPHGKHGCAVRPELQHVGAEGVGLAAQKVLAHDHDGHAVREVLAPRRVDGAVPRDVDGPGEQRAGGVGHQWGLAGCIPVGVVMQLQPLNSLVQCNVDVFRVGVHAPLRRRRNSVSTRRCNFVHLAILRCLLLHALAPIPYRHHVSLRFHAGFVVIKRKIQRNRGELPDGAGAHKNNAVIVGDRQTLTEFRFRDVHHILNRSSRFVRMSGAGGV